MERKVRRNNLRSLFKVQDLPSNQGIRNIIDIVDIETAFRSIFSSFDKIFPITKTGLYKI